MTFDLPTRPRAIVTEPPMRAPTGVGGWRWTWRAQQTFPPVAEAIRLMLQRDEPFDPAVVPTGAAEWGRQSTRPGRLPFALPSSRMSPETATE